MKRLAEYVTADRIVFLKSKDKKSALNELVDTLASAEGIGDAEGLREAIFARERILSTGIGLGIAVPHAKISSVEEFVVAIGISHDGIPFEALDNKPVKIIVMIAGPEHQQNQYLTILAHTTLLLKNAANREAILAATTPEDVYKVITEGGV